MIEGAERIAVFTLTLVIRVADEDEARVMAEKYQVAIEGGAEVALLTADLDDEERERIPRLISILPPTVALLSEEVVEGP